MPPRSRESQLIRVAKALGDPTRFGLLQAIAGRDEISCQELTSLFPISQATVSHHLKVLTDAGLVSARKEGPFHYYRALREALAAHGRGLADAFAGGAAAAPRRAAGRARR
jgi:ArsR family transcriptional regulator